MSDACGATLAAAPADPRLADPRWNPVLDPRRRHGLRALILVQIAAALWYFTWLFVPAHVGNPVLYGALAAAEIFNLAQASGFWWTVSRRHKTRPVGAVPPGLLVDVFIPVYSEPVEVVEPTVAAATRLRGANVTVYLLDDGDSPVMAAMAARQGARYLTRTEHHGAKAGNINHALHYATGDFLLVLDCDHVPRPEFLERTLGYFADRRVAFVQTPQYYANFEESWIAGAAWSQQSLFFGAIAQGKDSFGSMICCGTNVLFRRVALDEVGGFPEDSVTEDFELSVKLHERGNVTAYVPEVLALGLGPVDMGAYVGQQLRWSRGCLSAIASVLRARLHLRLRLQYLLSSMYFLSGWTLLIYMSLPVARMLFGVQPLAATSADQFLIHFVPYFALSLLLVARAGNGGYTFNAFALQSACWWVHALSSIRAVLRREGRFVVTPKRARSAWQPRVVAPTLVTVAVLAGSASYALSQGASPSTFNNVCFALLHIVVLLSGAAPALRPAWVSRFDPRHLRPTPVTDLPLESS